MSKTLGILSSVAVLLLCAGEARAHPLLDDAVASYEDADFRTALRTFNLAARDADLSLEELVELFEMRALVHHAMGNDTAMRVDLERVVALRPNHRLGDLAPPPVRRAFHQLLEDQDGMPGGALVLEEKAFDEKPFVVSRLERVPKGLVHRIALQCEIGPEGRIVARTVQGKRVKLALPEGGYYERCEANAMTRRGTVLFTASIVGSRPEPAPATVPSPPVEPAPVPETPVYLPQEPVETKGPALITYKSSDVPSDEPSVKKKKKWPWIVAASVAVVAGGVTAGVLLSKRSNSSQPPPGGVTVNW